ncbi:MAG: creatininase family protein, partial [Acidobacteriota bacterium]|nr:creatininase family protein [Acidobacteriota bacterium]
AYQASRDGKRFLVRAPVAGSQAAITVLLNWKQTLPLGDPSCKLLADRENPRTCAHTRLNRLGKYCGINGPFLSHDRKGVFSRWASAPLPCTIRVHSNDMALLSSNQAVCTAVLMVAAQASAQSLTVKWEELTGGDFVSAIQQAQGTCLIPFGIIEKHGPHLPLGTDLINVRYASLHGAEQEYAVVFPQYFFGQIFEARHEPGTMAYSARLQLDLLQETTDATVRGLGEQRV